jgi:hypothetical protein
MKLEQIGAEVDFSKTSKVVRRWGCTLMLDCAGELFGKCQSDWFDVIKKIDL